MSSPIEPLDPSAKFAPAAEPPAQTAAPAAADQGDESKVEPAPADPPPATGDAEKPSEDAPLGPQGEKALDIWKTRAKTAETELKAAQQARDEALAKLADVGLPEQEQALAAARREAANEATATVTAAAAKALAAQALIAEAKGRLADPSDAVAFLDVTEFQVGADFTVDAAAIAEAVTSLLTRKPHLAAKGAPGVATTPVVPADGIGQGVRQKDAPSTQEQIAAAEKSGDMATAMALKSNQLFAALMARPTT